MIKISVIIPTYNRARRLKDCLNALAHQTQSADDFEVIVVNDGGTDDTEAMVSSLHMPYALKVIHQENQGQNVARNYGVQVSQGRYCLFLDDDIIAEPQLIAEHLHLHREHEGVIGLGQMSLHFANTSNWFIAAYLRGWRQHYEELNQGTREPTWHDCYAGNVSIGRSVFLDVGGFASDIRRAHDVELGYRLQQHGLRYIYLARAIGRQNEQKTVQELIYDLEKSGAGWAVLCKRHPEMYSYLIGSITQGLRESLLREIVWRFGVSPNVLAKLGGLLGGTSWSRKWFRFINQYCRWRGYRRATSSRTSTRTLVQGTPILMYHAFGATGERASRFVVPINRFIQQMRLLKWLGYRVMSLEEFQQHHLDHRLPPTNSVVLTIDDGYSELYDLVYPVLKHHGIPATVFIVSEKANGCNDWTSLDELKGRRLLTWDQIREMAQHGVQFAAHSRTHARLVAISQDQIDQEISGSKADLENALQAAITAFAYPYGEFNSETQAAIRNAGFQGGYGADSGLNILESPSFALHRIEVDGTLSLLRFALALWLGMTR